MSRTIQKFRIIRRPATVNSSFSLVVIDSFGPPHLSLTTFYHRLGQQLVHLQFQLPEQEHQKAD
jgi:hypothetical protein